MPSNINILKIRKIRPKVGPLTPHEPPFNPINQPWDPSRSIELEEIYILVDLEFHSVYLMAIHAKTRGPMVTPGEVHRLHQARSMDYTRRGPSIIPGEVHHLHLVRSIDYTRRGSLITPGEVHWLHQARFTGSLVPRKSKEKCHRFMA